MRFDNFDEFKEFITNKYSSVKDLVFAQDGEILKKLESYARTVENNREEFLLVIQAYKSIFYKIHEEYYNKDGYSYQYENFIYFQRCINNEKLWFNNDGYCLRYNKDTLVCLDEDGRKIDLLFGKIDNLKHLINNKYFIIFRRKDYSDIEIIKHIYNKYYENNSRLNRDIIKYFIERGIVYERNHLAQ